MLHRHRLALVAATFAVAAPVGLTVTAPADAKAFPKKVERAYMKGCVEAATKQGASRKEAKAYCRATLKCLEKNLTLSEFKELGKAIDAGDKTPPHNKVLKKCQKAAG